MMRFSCFLTTLVFCCAFGVMIPQVASACIFTFSNASLVWPIPDGRDGAVPVATDTQVWYMIFHLGADWEVKLLYENGDSVSFSSVEMFDHPYNGQLGYSSFVMLTPDEPLEPNSTYTFTSEVGVQGQPEPDRAVYTFTTSGGLDQGVPPMLESADLFVFEGEQGGSDCGFPGASRQYTARISEPSNTQPFYYKIVLEFADKEPLVGEFFSMIQFEDVSPFAVLSAFTFEQGEYPCATITKRDVYGREVQTASSCEWSCKVFERDLYTTLSDGMEERLVNCPEEEPDMGQPHDMGMVPEDMSAGPGTVPPEPGDGMEEEDDDDSATCSSVGGGSAPETPLALLGVAWLVTLRRRTHGGCDA